MSMALPSFPGLFSSRFSPRFLSLRPLPPSRGGKVGMGGRSTAWALHRPGPPPPPPPPPRGGGKNHTRGGGNRKRPVTLCPCLPARGNKEWPTKDPPTKHSPHA